MPKFRPLPPVERLNELLEVVEIPEDKFGKWSGLVWKTSRGRQRAGNEAGTARPCYRKNGRSDWIVKVDGITYVASRVIYFMAYGEDPSEVEVDHKDQNWLNNNAWNLRLDVNGNVQDINKPMYRNNVSGVVGVGWYKGKWRARVNQKQLGRFTCKIEAAHAVNEKWHELGWLELGRKLNDLSAVQCDCDKCKSHLDKIAE